MSLKFPFIPVGFVVASLVGALLGAHWTFGFFLTGPPGLVFGTFVSLVAAVYVFRAAFDGLPPLRTPRIVLGVCVSMMSSTYAIDLVSDRDNGLLEWRRGIAFAIFASLAWTTFAVSKFWKREKDLLNEIRQEVEDDRRSKSQILDEVQEISGEVHRGQ